MIYNSNQDDIDHRHVWTVPVDGSAKPARLAVKSIGSEWQPSVTSDGIIAMLHADAQHAAARDGDVAGRQRALAAREHAAGRLRRRRRSSRRSR